jgi:tripartite-type tricarboxylate transporter receptor subunit TctC
MALVAPAGTPQPVIATLSDALQKALPSSAVRERFASLGAEPLAGTAADHTERVKQETGAWTPMLKPLDLMTE